MKKHILSILTSVLISLSSVFGLTAYHQNTVELHTAAVLAQVEKRWQDMKSSVISIPACSGVMVGKDLLLTAAHCDVGMVKYDIIKKDDALDLMLVKYTPTVPYTIARLGTAVTVDEIIHAVGYPLALGVQYTTSGRVVDGALTEVVEYPEFGTKMAFTAPVIFGNSGGGIFNSQGELVGIASMMAMAGFGSPVTHMGFAVNIETIHKFLVEAHTGIKFK